MFESFKSAKTLEHELREWHVEHKLWGLPPEDRELFQDGMVDYVTLLDERALALEGVEIVMRLMSLNQFGTPVPRSEHSHWCKVLRLAKAFAKAKGWQICGNTRDGFRYLKQT